MLDHALGNWINAVVAFLVERNAGVFDAIGRVLERFTAGVEDGLLAVPAWALIALVTAVAWRRMPASRNARIRGARR
jgi:glycine betaine/proline transport system permease protein